MKEYIRLNNGEVVEAGNGTTNLLDLVRVGDLVELNGKPNHDNDIHMIVNNCEGDLITWDNLFLYKSKVKDVLVAIWFRSGDTMKRIEVKGE